MSPDPRLCLSSKTVRWSGEREWRIFKSEKGEASYGDEKAVTKIFLGSRTSEDDEKRVRNAGVKLGVPVVKMAIDAYSITFKSQRPVKLVKFPIKR
jgi:hypothetical protein